MPRLQLEYDHTDEIMFACSELFERCRTCRESRVCARCVRTGLYENKRADTRREQLILLNEGKGHDPWYPMGQGEWGRSPHPGAVG